MRGSILLCLLAVSCGGRVVDEPSNNSPDGGGNEKIQVSDAAASTPPSEPTSKPGPDASALPPPDTYTPPTPTDASVVTCADGPATGAPMGCGPDKACNAGETVTDEWARDLLSCFVDRCSVATTGKPWCGTIGLKFSADGCTMDYTESGPGAGGCVKYQGLYRSWPCLAGRSISVTRPCP